jgi:replicative DNA helicase
MNATSNIILSEEILSLMINDRDAGLVVSENFDITFLPTAEHQSIYQAIRHSYFKDNSATWGGVYELLTQNKEALNLLMSIKKIDVDSKAVFSGIENYLKDRKFKKLYDKQYSVYKKEDSFEKFNEIKKLFQEYLDYCDKINLSAELTRGLIETLEETEQERLYRKNSTPLSLGIKPLDHYTFGGIREGELWLLLSDSGGGKSTCLRYMGIQALLQGKRVLHFQAEDSKQACVDLYKSTLFQINSSRFMFNTLDKASNDKIAQQVKEFQKNMVSDLYIEAFEEFGSASLTDCYSKIKKLEKKYGKFDLIIFDYLDEIEMGDGKSYGTDNEGVRAKKSAVCKGMKNIALEFNTRVITATQSNNITLTDKNNPDFYLTRENIADNKALIRPVNLFFTITQTYAEAETNSDRDYEIARIFIDKYRTGKDKISFKIAQSRNNSQFYNDKQTCENFWCEVKKQPKLI